eukprot:TRINITY_DN7062_c0_g1_i1.p1 TRINITY_DN7062_c0_g1~~TRINITY_DN7062_c0_g1_i1.p1  ORF type:complete len:256 (+),score=58.36 TRINITY_DN7062_c0_g1_i1:68-769(+)
MPSRGGRRLRNRPLTVALALAGVSGATVSFLRSSAASFLSVAGRREAIHAATLGSVFGTLSQAPLAAFAEEEKEDPTLGYVPKEYSTQKMKVGEKTTTPHGLEFELLEKGTEGTAPRDGPVKGGARVWVKFTGHTDSFDGPVFDSSEKRASRAPGKREYMEITVNRDYGYTNGLWEALKLMKTGDKGRFVQPPLLSYGQGKKSFTGDEELEVKEVPAGATLYYQVELLNIVKP